MEGAGPELTSGGGNPLLGETVKSWRIVDIIGVGAMGTVYRGVHNMLGSAVAIKVLSGKDAGDSGQERRFLAEALAIAQLRHKNIVDILDVGHLPDRRPYFVMEYVDGAPLSKILRTEGRLSIERVVQIGQEILRGLAAAHERGIFHRDVKPANILVARSGAAKLVDFGVAKVSSEVASVAPMKTTTAGSLIGTPAYLSPEQASGAQIDGRADLYAVGVTLYEMLAGHVPFVAQGLYEMLRMHQEMPPPSLRQLRPEIPPALEAVVFRALGKRPEARFAHAAEMANALGASLTAPAPAPAPLPLPPPEHPEVTGEHDAAPSSSLRWITIVAVLVGAGIAVLLGWHLTVPPAPPAPPTPTGDYSPAP